MSGLSCQSDKGLFFFFSVGMFNYMKPNTQMREKNW